MFQLRSAGNKPRFHEEAHLHICQQRKWFGGSRVCFQGHCARDKRSRLWIGQGETRIAQPRPAEKPSPPLPNLPPSPRPPRSSFPRGEPRKCSTPRGTSPVGCTVKSCLICRTGPGTHASQCTCPMLPDVHVLARATNLVPVSQSHSACLV